MSTHSFGTLSKMAMCVFAMLLTEIHGAHAQLEPIPQALLPKAPKRSEVVASGGKLIPGNLVRQLHLGNTVYYTRLVDFLGFPRGHVGAMFYRDERVVLNMYGGNKTEMLWWMEGDALCNQLPNKSGHSCALIYYLEDKALSCNRAEDICRFWLRTVPGNPEKY